MKRIIKLFVLVLFLVSTLTSKAQMGYVDKLSLKHGDIDTIYINTSIHPVGNYIHLYNLQGQIIDSALVINHHQVTNRIDTLTLDHHYVPTAVYNCHLTKSGIYLWENSIVMILKSSSPKPITVVYPTNTCNAYSTAGGKSFYSTPRTSRASFHRAIYTSNSFAISGYTWLSRTPFDTLCNYICDLDLEDSSSLKGSKLIIVGGHSEYWTRNARLHFDEFINHGNHAIVASGNTMWWQVRYEQNNSVLTCYKSKTNDTITNPLLKTTQWIDSTLHYPVIQSIGADYSGTKYGNYPTCGFNGFKIIKPCSPLFKNITLRTDSIITVKTREFDGFPIYISNHKFSRNLSWQKHYKSELIGYDWSCYTSKVNYGTFYAFQKSKTSGKIIQIGSTDWFAGNGFGNTDSIIIQKTTYNCIHLLLKDSDIFCSPNHYVIIDSTICAGNSLSFNGQQLHVAGTYFDTLTNSFGADSIVELNLHFTQNSYSILNISICQGNRYLLGTNSYATTGCYVNHFSNYLGCDSVVTLNLLVKQSSSFITKRRLCFGQNLLWNNKSYSQNTIDTMLLVNAQGCDSIDILNLVIDSPVTSHTHVQACASQSFQWHNKIYSQSGTYSDTLVSALGCDSFTILHLMIHATIIKNIYDTICKGQQFLFANLNIQHPGSYWDTLKSYTNCDSIIQLKLYYSNTFCDSIIHGSDSIIHGSNLIKHNDTNSYFIQSDNLIHYQWNIIGGNLLNTNDTNAITIRWYSSGIINPSIELICIDKWACTDTIRQLLEWNTNGIYPLNKTIIADIFPNPFLEEINIYFNSAKERTILIYDMKGILVGEERTNLKKNKIHFAANLNSGTYDLLIKENGLAPYHYKLIKSY